MEQYVDLLEKILLQGMDIPNKRTGVVCRTILSHSLTFDMDDGFPLVTLRKVHHRAIIGELLGFFRGYTSAADFRKLSSKYWDGNANKSAEWLANPLRKGEDDCGAIYGTQWTAWTNTKVLNLSDISPDALTYLTGKGWKILGNLNGDSSTIVISKVINQLEDVVRKIMTDPTNRRIIITGWNPGDYDFQCLPACHMNYIFLPDTYTNRLNVVMTIRSSDVYLGLPANIASASVMLAIISRLTGYIPGNVGVQITNAHLYANQIAPSVELLSRPMYELPRLVIENSVKRLSSVKDIEGCFTRIQPEDIEVIDYISGAALPVEMVS